MSGPVSLFRFATAELIAFGIVGTMLDGAYETLVEIDYDMAAELEDIMIKVMERFHAAEEVIFNTPELQ
jgi:hypothetical protein